LTKNKSLQLLAGHLSAQEYFTQNLFRILQMKNEEKDKMKTIIVTQEEINQATRPNVYRNRKKYTRKDKHRNKSIED
jgi:hypothetical protein